MPIDVIMTFADGSRIRHTVDNAVDFSNAAYSLENMQSYVDAANPDKVYFRTGLVAVEKAPTEGASAD